MLPTKAEITKHANGFLTVLKAYVDQTFDLNVDNMEFKLNFKNTHRTGLGGCTERYGQKRGFMSLNVGLLVTNEVIAFSEYKSLLKYTDITSFETTDWRLWLETLMCHEMAHVVQFMLPHSDSSLFTGKTHETSKSRRVRGRTFVSSTTQKFYAGLGWSEQGHGDFFIRIYAKLRKQFVNSRVTPAYRFMEQFKRKDGEVTLVKRKTANHKLLGSEFTYKGETMKLVEYLPRMRTYRFLGVGQTSGKRVRFAEESVHMYMGQDVARLALSRAA